MNKYTDPHIASSALITIDTQNDFTLENSPAFIEGTLNVIPNMVRLLKLYRSKGLPVVHVVRLYPDDGSNVELCRRQEIEDGRKMVSPDTDGAELVSQLKPNASMRLNANQLLSGQFQQVGDNEFIMYKPRWGAFYKTALEEFLKQREIDTLVFTGCNYPNCPRTSIYQASERDFRVILIKDAMSQLYSKAETEMENIGVSLLNTSEIENLMA